jgi:hypothetical protein
VNLDPEERDERRVTALREALSRYAEAANESDAAPSEEERQQAQREAEALRELALALAARD